MLLLDIAGINFKLGNPAFHQSDAVGNYLDFITAALNSSNDTNAGGSGAKT